MKIHINLNVYSQDSQSYFIKIIVFTVYTAHIGGALFIESLTGRTVLQYNVIYYAF